MTSQRPAQRPALSSASRDRAAGVLLAQACGDALGAPTEFQAQPLPSDHPIEMTGGGIFGWARGEWTDDTQMSIAILQAAESAVADGVDLIDRLDEIAASWVAWSHSAPDVGIQTSRVLGSGATTADGLRTAALAVDLSTGKSGGNGSLMRTAPVALALLGDPQATASTARAISELTHADPEAGDACVLWCRAIQHAIEAGAFDPYQGLHLLPPTRRDTWADRLREAEQRDATDFPKNGWVVHALQAAWSLIARTPVPGDDPESGQYPATHLREVLQGAARLAGDTDTVGAIAGALVGARWGASAVPARWRRIVHGWPGLTGMDLARRGAALAGGCDHTGWPLGSWVDYGDSAATGTLVAHPRESRLLLGDVLIVDDLPAQVDAIVSLCRMGTEQVPRIAPADRIETWLLDSAAPGANPNLHFALADTADVIAELLAEGKTVLVHCVAAQSRTPTIAAAYAIRHLRTDPQAALDEACALLPDPQPNAAFRAALVRLARPGLPGVGQAGEVVQ